MTVPCIIGSFLHVGHAGAWVFGLSKLFCRGGWAFFEADNWASEGMGKRETISVFLSAKPCHQLLCSYNRRINALKIN